MAEVSYNQSWDSSPAPQYTPVPGSTQEPNNNPSNKKAFPVIALVAAIVLMIALSIYLIFGRQVTKPIPPEIIKQALPSGPPLEQ